MREGAPGRGNRHMPERHCYLNTDLELVSKEDPGRLVDRLEALGWISLHSEAVEDGFWRSCLETRCVRPLTPNDTIISMLNDLEELPTQLFDVWRRCTKREFNIGLDAAAGRFEIAYDLTNQTLRRVAGLGASLTLTIYPRLRGGRKWST